jgi:hypothetical protein
MTENKDQAPYDLLCRSEIDHSQGPYFALGALAAEACKVVELE